MGCNCCIYVGFSTPYESVPKPTETPTTSHEYGSIPRENTQRSVVIPPSEKKSGWEINYKEIVCESEIGRGAHGFVLKGKWRGISVAGRKFREFSFNFQ